ncbi:MAG: phage tail tube protein [Oscillospiraceae bacterium]
MNGFDNGGRIINGTFGTAWIDNEQVGECFGLQLKISATKADINIPGKLMSDSKIKSLKGTGAIKLYKTNSRMAIKLADTLKSGKDLRCTIISKLSDPDAYGAERVAVSGVSFDDLILADWELNTEGKTDVPFTFTDYEYLDRIEVR